MKKTLLIVGGSVVVLLLAGYIGVDLFLGSIVKTEVNRLLPQMTKTKVELSGAHLSPLSGSGTLTGFYVGNPKGWNSDKAFYLEKIHFDVVPSSIFTDQIVINDITIDGPEFVYETKVVSSNIGELLKNIESSGGSGNATQAKTKTGKPMKFVVKRLRLQNGRVTVGVGPGAITLPMPPIELDNLGGDQGGVTSSELAVVIMRTLVTSVVDTTTHAVGKIGSTMGAAAGDATKKAAEGLKGLFGGKSN